MRTATRMTALVARCAIALLVALLLPVVQAPPASAAPPGNDAFADAVVLGPARQAWWADLGDEEDPVPALEQAPEARDQRRDLSSGMAAMSMDRLARSLNSSRPPVAVVTDGSGVSGSV